jgi:hypothetical protein
LIWFFQGNYFGAVKGWTESLEPPSGQSFTPDSNIFAIVDLHAITLPQKPGNYCNECILRYDKKELL